MRKCKGLVHLQQEGMTEWGHSTTKQAVAEVCKARKQGTCKQSMHSSSQATTEWFDNWWQKQGSNACRNHSISHAIQEIKWRNINFSMNCLKPVLQWPNLQMSQLVSFQPPRKSKPHEIKQTSKMTNFSPSFTMFQSLLHWTISKTFLKNPSFLWIRWLTDQKGQESRVKADDARWTEWQPSSKNSFKPLTTSGLQTNFKALTKCMFSMTEMLVSMQGIQFLPGNSQELAASNSNETPFCLVLQLHVKFCSAPLFNHICHQQCVLFLSCSLIFLS